MIKSFFYGAFFALTFTVVIALVEKDVPTLALVFLSSYGCWALGCVYTIAERS
jgi:3'-phosphoadenosine 5'-phosphosulfate (PAPS) 3'-phosphatase